MPTTRSTFPTNHSGLQRGSPPSKHKRSNADEHARKCLKDEVNVEMGEKEEGGQKMKGGRSGKKAKGMKKRRGIRKTSTDKAREKVAAKEAVKKYKETEHMLTHSGHKIAPPARTCTATSPGPATSTHSCHQRHSDPPRRDQQQQQQQQQKYHRQQQ
ncbi:hypothetical protein BYT27DRAFT_7261695 [Phlegmacium glaucopus]|nr:hypothetical protein BYT27DRAFT_7261695 [Phlegmacium glaucopus]